MSLLLKMGSNHLICLFFPYFPFCGVDNVEGEKKSFVFTKYIMLWAPTKKLGLYP